LALQLKTILLAARGKRDGIAIKDILREYGYGDQILGHSGNVGSYGSAEFKGSAGQAGIIPIS
jgi:hypothetical protein